MNDCNPYPGHEYFSTPEKTINSHDIPDYYLYIQESEILKGM
jgi:hypothetical protein